MNKTIHQSGSLSLVDIRRRLHSFAECGFSLPKTTSFVKDTLQNLGYKPKACGKAGVLAALLSPKKDAPTVLLRADMDALPIREETRLCFRAENGCMHACGHDMHTAMLLGAAALLKKEEGKLPFSVRFAFQGAEELLSGAEDLRKNGALEGACAAASLHVIPALPLPTGTVLLPPEGIAAPAAFFFSFEIKGKSAHVGEKEKGTDALAVGVRLYTAILDEAAQLENALSVSIGRFRAGDAPNIVPGHTTIEGTARTKDVACLAAFRQRLLALKELWSTRGTHVTLHITGEAPPLKNDHTLLARIRRHLTQEGIPYLTPKGGAGAAAEDFSVFAAHLPAVALAIAAGEKGHGYDRPLHHPSVLFDEDVLPKGAALYVSAARALGEGIPLQTFTNPPIV